MNIAIIGQNHIFRDSLKTLLNQVDDFNIMFECAKIQDFLDDPDASVIDLILIDGVIGTYSYSEIVNRIRKYSAKIKVLILTEKEEHYYWENQKKFKIEGTLLKNAKKNEFEEKIRSLI
jgi:DNA-binding NarL/FixJ family response regulator